MLKRTHPSLDVPTDTRQTRNKVELEQRTRRQHGATGRGTLSVAALAATQTGSSENCPRGCLSQTLAFGPPWALLENRPPRLLAGNKAVRVSFPRKKRVKRRAIPRALGVEPRPPGPVTSFTPQGLGGHKEHDSRQPPATRRETRRRIEQLAVSTGTWRQREGRPTRRNQTISSRRRLRRRRSARRHRPPLLIGGSRQAALPVPLCRRRGHP